MHGLGQRRPILHRGPPDRHRTVLAVRRTAEIDVVLKLPEERQHVVPAPARGAKRLPFGVIVGRATIRNHAHHRRTAADHVCLREARQRRIILPPPMRLQSGPEIGIVVVGARIGIENVVRFRARWRITARFNQKHARRGTRRQPVRQHTPGRAAADNDDIKVSGHGLLVNELCGQSRVTRRTAAAPDAAPAHLRRDDDSVRA